MLRVHRSSSWLPGRPGRRAECAIFGVLLIAGLSWNPGRSHLDVAVDTCAPTIPAGSLTDVMRAIRSRAVLHQSETRYEQLRASCEWVDRPVDTIKGSVMGMFRAKTLPRHGYPRTTYARPPTNITYCAFEDAGEEWQVLRVGPFVTRGDNHSVDWLMDKAFRPDENARTYVTDSFSAILDEHGSVVGNPTVHFHHMILCHGQPYRLQGSRDAPIGDYFGYKGEDMVCDPERGGTACLYFKSPRCFGQPYLKPLSVSFGYDDIRATDSPPMVTYTEVAIRVHRGVMPHELVWFAMTTSQFDYNIPTTTHNNMWPNFFAAPVKKGALSAYWISSIFPFDGEVLYVFAHDHRIAEKYVHVWGAPPESLGLNQGKLVLPDVGDNQTVYSEWGEHLMRKPLIFTGSVDELLGHLAPPPPGTPECSTHASPTHAIDPRLNTFWLGSMDHQLRCDPWRFKRGDYQTLLCVMQTPDEWPEEYLGQHCNFHALVLSDDKVERMYETQYYANSAVPDIYMFGEGPEAEHLQAGAAP